MSLTYFTGRGVVKVHSRRCKWPGFLILMAENILRVCVSHARAHTHTTYSPARPPPDTEAAPTCRQCRCRGRGVLAELVFPFPSDKDPGAQLLGHVVGLARLLWSTPHPAAPQAAAARPGCASPRLHAPRVLGDGRSRLCSALPGGRAASPRAARWPSGVFFR